MLLPGDPAPRPLTSDSFGNRLRLWDADGRYPLAEMAPGSPQDAPSVFQQANNWAPGRPLLDGMAFVPPPIFWSLLVPRQPAGSAALRALDAGGARRLLDAALADLPTAPQLGHRPEVPAAEKMLGAVVPAVTEPRLRQAVLGAVILGARLVRQLEGLDRRGAAGPTPVTVAQPLGPVLAAASVAAPGAAPAATPPVVAVARAIDDAALGQALVGLAPGRWPQFAYGGGGGRPLEQLATVAEAMAEQEGCPDLMA